MSATAKQTVTTSESFSAWATNGRHPALHGVVTSAIIALRHFASDDEYKCSHTGVHVAVRGGHLEAVATSGKHLVRLRTMAPVDDGACIIPASALKTAAQHIGRGKKRGSEITINATGAIEVAGITIAAPFIDAEFPDYCRVIPAPRPSKKPVGFDMRLVSDVAKVLVELGDTNCAAAYHGADDTCSPALWTASLPCGELDFVVMPMKL
jgi:hypothetical protein